MDMNLAIRNLTLICLMSVVSGCGSSETPVTSTDPDLLEGLLDSDEEDRTSSGRKRKSADDDTTDSESTDADDSMLSPGNSEGEEPDERSSGRRKTKLVSRTADRSKGRKAEVAGDRLELTLKKGDRFPLIKTIEQTLIQKSADTPAMAHTRLELTMAIEVEQAKTDAILLGVKYSKVAYEHDVNGQQLVYDSSNHQGEIPWDVIPYAGMVNNGFSFWLGRDNRIREMVGYREFLERCVANVPLDRRELLLSEISNRFGDDGVANFIDDSIGLLPYDDSVDPDSATLVKTGDVWMRERTLMQPIPIHMKSTYRLTDMNETSAEIDIMGRIAAGDAVGNDQRSRLRITGGHSLGRCVVDRATGLPTDMNLTRFIKMKIMTPDQQEIQQEKQIVTSIRTFPEMRSKDARGNGGSAIRRVSGTSSSGRGAKPIPTSSAPGEPVEAVYPD